jgi:hypothetical protein
MITDAHHDDKDDADKNDTVSIFFTAKVDEQSKLLIK